MAGRSAIESQLCLAAESTYGTYVAGTRFLEFTSESMKLQIERNESAGLRSGDRVLRSDHWGSGKRQAGGDLEFDVANKGFGLLLTQMMLGAVATTADGTGKKHAGTIGDLYGDMMSVQVGRPDVSGTVQPYSYVGCKVKDWELTQEVDAFLKLKLGVDARDETTSQSLVSASAPAVTELFHWSGLSMTVAGSAFDATKFSLKCDNKLKDDRFHLRGSTLKKEPIESDKREITGELTGEFESLTAYNRFVNGTLATIVATWVCVSTYDTAKPFKIVLTLNSCRFDGETPNVGSPDVLEQPLPFKVLYDGTNSAVMCDYYTSDASP